MKKSQQEWWFMPVISAKWEVEVGRSQSEAGSGKSARPYLKK
jgi:hypothetical protein